ncbi:RNA-directed DNA polymerase, eukaryota [Tanacetum coccineum]
MVAAELLVVDGGSRYHMRVADGVLCLREKDMNVNMWVVCLFGISDSLSPKDHRPISLIGYYYKILTKILAERIKKVIGKVIEKVQNAFIKGRYILNGALVANETIDYLKSPRKQGLVFKVDFGKAYDGLRQGDPLAPFLFLIAAEGLNVVINEAVKEGYFKGVKKHQGLKINRNKSKLFGIGVTREEVKEMAGFLRFCPGKLPCTYLGLPLGANMNRAESWDPVVEKFKNRLCDWRAKSISFGGRLTLVRSVLGSLSLYYFSLFRAPVESDAWWVRVIKSVYGEDGGVDGEGHGRGRGAWGNIIKVGSEMGKIGLNFANSFRRRVGNGEDTRFWLDKWVGEFRLCDNYPRVGPVAYTLELPEELKGIHSTFHVSNLKKCLAEGDVVVPMEEIQLDDKLHMIEEPVEIVDKEVKRLKQSRIPIVKVRWNSQRGP